MLHYKLKFIISYVMSHFSKQLKSIHSIWNMYSFAAVDKVNRDACLVSLFMETIYYLIFHIMGLNYLYR